MPAVLRLFLIALVALSTGHVAANEAPTIAAAADLRFALERLAEDFRAKTGNAIRVSFRPLLGSCVVRKNSAAKPSSTNKPVPNSSEREFFIGNL